MIVESFIVYMNKIMLFSAYVNNASNFPKPLSADEEKSCFDAYHRGDKIAKDKLIAHNLRLVVHIVKKYSGAAESDDLISVGSIGLIKAVNTYSQDKNTQFSTYAARCIENEILMLLRANKKHQSVLSLSESMGKDRENDDITLGDVIPNEDYDLQETVENAVLTEKFMNIIEKSLSHREYQIMSMRYGLGGTTAYTQREIAKKLGISRSYISRLEKKSIEVIREKTKDENLIE